MKTQRLIIVTTMILLGIISAQSITVMYIDDDSGAALFGQWELYNNEGNLIETVDSNNSTTTELIVGETYQIRVSENASTVDDTESDRWFLHWSEELATNLDLVNEINVNSSYNFNYIVKYKNKIPITFSITENIEAVYILDPWARAINGELINDFMPLSGWIENNPEGLFSGRGISLDILEPHYYQLKTKRLTATAGTGNDGIYRIESWAGEGIQIHPIVPIDPYDFEIPEYMTGDFYYVSPIIFNNGYLIEMNIVFDQVSQNLEVENIFIFEGEELFIYPDADIEFANKIELIGSLYIGEEDGLEVNIISTWSGGLGGQINGKIDSKLNIHNTIFSDYSDFAIRLNGLINEYSPGEIDVVINNTVFQSELDCYDVKLSGVSSSENINGLIHIYNSFFDNGLIISSNLNEVIIENNYFTKKARIKSDWICCDINVNHNEFYLTELINETVLLDLHNAKGSMNIQNNIVVTQVNDIMESQIIRVKASTWENNLHVSILQNTIIATENWYGMVIKSNGGTINVENNIVYNDTQTGIGVGIDVEDNIVEENFEVNIGYNDIFGFSDAILITNENVTNIGIQNILSDPILNQDFQLEIDSPCINTGNPNFPLDPDGTLSDIGTFYFPNNLTAPNLSLTFESGNPRLNWVVADPAIIDHYILHIAYIPINEEDGRGRSIILDEPTYFDDEFLISKRGILRAEYTVESIGTYYNRSPLSNLKFVYGDIDLSREKLISDIRSIKFSTAFPNPFNPITNITYEIPEESHISISIYDLAGRKLED